MQNGGLRAAVFVCADFRGRSAAATSIPPRQGRVDASDSERPGGE